MAPAAGAPLPPLAPEGAPACGSLRLQLFLSLPSRTAAELGTAPLRVNLRFGGDAGDGTWASLDLVTGCVVAWPLLGAPSACRRYLASASHVTLTLYSASARTPFGRALIDCAATATQAACAQTAQVLPVGRSSSSSSSLSGATVDASWRLSVWDTAEDDEEEEDADADGESESQSAAVELLPVASGRFSAAAPARFRRFKLPSFVMPSGRNLGAGIGAMTDVWKGGRQLLFALLDAPVSSADAAERRDLHRVAATLCFGLSCVCNPYLGQNMQLGQPADGMVTLHPSPQGFTIAWPTCYTLLLLYILYQALPAKHDSTLLRKCGWRTAAALASMSLWSALATVASRQRGPPPTYWSKIVRAATAGGLASGVLSTVFCFVQASRSLCQYGVSFTEIEHVCVVAPLGLAAGWVATLAPSQSLSFAVDLLALLGMAPPPLTGSPAAVALLLSGMGTCLAAWELHGHPYFTLAAVWGFACTAQRNTRTGLLAAAAAQGEMPGSVHGGDLGAVWAAVVAAGCIVSVSLARILVGGARRWGFRRGGGNVFVRMWEECCGG